MSGLSAMRLGYVVVLVAEADAGVVVAAAGVRFVPCCHVCVDERELGVVSEEDLDGELGVRLPVSHAWSLLPIGAAPAVERTVQAAATALALSHPLDASADTASPRRDLLLAPVAHASSPVGS